MSNLSHNDRCADQRKKPEPNTTIVAENFSLADAESLVDILTGSKFCVFQGGQPRGYSIYRVLERQLSTHGPFEYIEYPLTPITPEKLLIRKIPVRSNGKVTDYLHIELTSEMEDPRIQEFYECLGRQYGKW